MFSRFDLSRVLPRGMVLADISAQNLAENRALGALRFTKSSALILPDAASRAGSPDNPVTQRSFLPSPTTRTGFPVAGSARLLEFWLRLIHVDVDRP